MSKLIPDPFSVPLKQCLSVWPVRMPGDWVKLVNQPQDEKELAALRLNRDRGQPFGETGWVLKTAGKLGLESTLRPLGRPKGAGKKMKVT